MADAAVLERQLEELTALGSMYPNDGEFLSSQTPDGLLSVTVSISIMEARATMHMTLPANYPTCMPPSLQLSCLQISAEEVQAVKISLEDLATSAVVEDREVLAELCLHMQSELESILADKAVQPSTSSLPPLREPSRAAFGRRMIWFHHIKSLEKRKHIISQARAVSLRGFCKPGFPGVLVIEGPEVDCEDFIGAIRGLRWQAMDVRWQQKLASEPLPTTADDGSGRRLPEPFIELAESAMGEAAAICERAGLLGAFRSSVLKLESGSSDGNTGRACDAVCQLATLEDVSDGSSDPHCDLEDLQLSPPSGQWVACAAGAAVKEETEEECVIYINHFNDAAGYSKQLQRWVTQLGLTGTLLYSTADARPPHRWVYILVVLRGPRSSIGTFLQRLRSQAVDVDRTGRPCKERQATVRWRKPLPAMQSDGHDGPEPSQSASWTLSECGDDTARTAALHAFGIRREAVIEILGIGAAPSTARVSKAALGAGNKVRG